MKANIKQIDDLLDNLQSKSQVEQLLTIKSLEAHASNPEVIRLIKLAIKTESSPWIKRALETLLNSKKTLKPEIAVQPNIPDVTDDIDIEAIKSEAISESIGQVLHELEPLIGTVVLYANSETENFENSKLKNELDRLEETVVTFRDWQRVEENPRFRLVNIFEVIDTEVKRCNRERNLQITINISSDIEFETDRSLLRIFVSNAIRNSIDATGEPTSSKPIIINGGLTDKSLWITVLDNGDGLKSEQSTLLKSKYTTKAGHNGLGLTIVNKAINALKGTWSLKNRETVGAECFFEIPFRDET